MDCQVSLGALNAALSASRLLNKDLNLNEFASGSSMEPNVKSIESSQSQSDHDYYQSQVSDSKCEFSPMWHSTSYENMEVDSTGDTLSVTSSFDTITSASVSETSSVDYPTFEEVFEDYPMSDTQSVSSCSTDVYVDVVGSE